MKEIWRLLRASSRLGRKNFLLILIPALVWVVGVHSRSTLLKTHCAESTSQCAVEDLFSVDRFTVSFEDRRADHLSFVTQETAAWIAVSGPFLWHLASVLTRSALPAVAVVSAVEDAVFLLQAVVWNGAILEAVRVLVQRPRPFVYKDPAGLGANPAHYISFYSGHTSFVAVVTLALFWILLRRRAHPTWVILALVASVLLTFLTGIFRVLAGRHFATDVIAAMLAGYAVATLVSRFHRNAEQNPK